MDAVTLGMIVGKRALLPDRQREPDRHTVSKILGEPDVRKVALSLGETSPGSVESLCATSAGEGELTDELMARFGGSCVARIPRFQALLHHISENKFEHYVTTRPSLVAGAVREALSKYLGWDVHSYK